MQEQTLEGKLTSSQIARMVTICNQFIAVHNALNGNAMQLIRPIADLIESLEQFKAIEEKPKSRGKSDGSKTNQD